MSGAAKQAPETSLADVAEDLRRMTDAAPSLAVLRETTRKLYVDLARARAAVGVSDSEIEGLSEAMTGAEKMLRILDGMVKSRHSRAEQGSAER